MGAYRILSLDGGGSWALLQVMALQSVYGEKCHGHDVLKDFNLVSANSGGSIVLGGLLTNKPLDEILKFFLDTSARKSVFKNLPFDFEPGDKPLRSVWNQTMSFISPVGAKYATSAKYDGLRELLNPAGDKTLLEHHQYFVMRHSHSIHFLICGFDYDRKRAKFFRSNSASLAGSSQVAPSFIPVRKNEAQKRDVTLAQAIHASTNAPVKYFIEPALIESERYWDGAIGGYNNPVLAGVVEALANAKHYSRDDIEVLSIGTGTVSLPPGDSATTSDPRLVQKTGHESTLFGDVGQLATSILDDPPDSATFIAHVVLGGTLPDRNAYPPVMPPVTGAVIRMSPLLRPIRSSPDAEWKVPEGMSIDTFLTLVELDLDAVDQEQIESLVRLGELWLADKIGNQAIRENKNFEVQIGQRDFSKAKAAWLQLRSGKKRL
jgi:uncharacterized protein